MARIESMERQAEKDREAKFAQVEWDKEAKLATEIEFLRIFLPTLRKVEI